MKNGEGEWYGRTLAEDAVEYIKSSTENAADKVKTAASNSVEAVKDAAESVKDWVSGESSAEEKLDVSSRVNTERDSGREYREVDTILTIERGKDNNALDVELDIVIDPESEKPMKVKIEAEVDNNTVEVSGEAAGKDKGTAHIEAEIERNGEALATDEMELNIEEKERDSDDMELKSDAN